jgi:Ca-activated chloride channel homolog
MTGVRLSSVVAVAIALGSMAAGPRAQQPVFKSAVDAVQVDVLVTRGGRPVAGLTAADFELRDSGVVQQVEVAALEDVPLRLLLVLDMSDSVQGEPLRQLKDAAHAAVATLRPVDRAALITFSNVVQLRVPFSGDTPIVQKAIDDVEAGGSTSLHDVAFAALAMRETVDGRMLVLIFTDGIDMASWLNPVTVIERARRSDVVVDGVLLKPGENQTRDARQPLPIRPSALRSLFFEEPQLFRQEFLGALADETGGELIVANAAGDLRATFLKIVAEFKTRYVLSYSPKNVPPSWWYPLDVKLKDKKGDIRARRGYLR